MSKIIFHIDVNSAYLSWTALQNLENGSDVDLRLIPSIIGGDIERRHGVVLAKSIPAKNYGIVTGEPVVHAIRKCPNLTLASPDHEMYEKRSFLLMEFLQSICPDIEQTSVDECFMDYTSIASQFPSPEAAAEYIKNEVYSRFSFTVNIGISDRKVLAKMASDFKKPNRVHTLYSYELAEKMWPLPVSSLYMCGKSSVDTLRKLEILTIGDLAKADLTILSAHLKSHGALLWEYANGIDDSDIMPEPAKRKGVGNSTTLSKDIVSHEEACHVLLGLSESVGRRLRSSHEVAGNICIEIKYSTFQSVSHQMVLDTPSSSNDILYRNAVALFDELWNHGPIRLLGIRTSKLLPENEPIQISLFDLEHVEVNAKQRNLDAALDSIHAKFGMQSVVRGSLLSNPDEFKKH